jgi:hypothetical protein
VAEKAYRKSWIIVRIERIVRWENPKILEMGADFGILKNIKGDMDRPSLS